MHQCLPFNWENVFTFASNLAVTLFGLAINWFSDLASFVKKGIYTFIAAEVIAAGGVFAGFCYLRRSEKSRKYLYQNLPAAVNLYYFAEDSISFGQLVVCI